MKFAKRIAAILLVLLMLQCGLTSALAVEDTNSGTTEDTTGGGAAGEDTENDGAGEGDTNTGGGTTGEGDGNTGEDNDEPIIITKPTYIYIENSTIDYSALNRQIAIANGLRESDYTKESWAVLEAALKTATYAQDSTNQEVVDNAAEELRAAISELVSMDYSALEQAILLAKGYIDGEEYELVVVLSELIAEAEILCSSGDQEAVDACVEKINLVISQLVASLPVEEEPEVIIREVEVEVPPTDDYCNISRHYLWPILLCISALVNVLLVVAIVLIIRRRKRRGEDVPLVDYDIDDDV